jgi:hypothetical protein
MGQGSAEDSASRARFAAQGRGDSRGNDRSSGGCPSSVIPDMGALTQGDVPIAVRGHHTRQILRSAGPYAPPDEPPPFIIPEERFAGAAAALGTGEHSGTGAGILRALAEKREDKRRPLQIPYLIAATLPFWETVHSLPSSMPIRQCNLGSTWSPQPALIMWFSPEVAVRKRGFSCHAPSHRKTVLVDDDDDAHFTTTGARPRPASDLLLMDSHLGTSFEHRQPGFSKSKESRRRLSTSMTCQSVHAWTHSLNSRHGYLSCGCWPPVTAVVRLLANTRQSGEHHGPSAGRFCMRPSLRKSNEMPLVMHTQAVPRLAASSCSQRFV